MTKSPERIWAYAGTFKMWRDHKTDRPHEQTEYVRADLVPQWEPIDTAPTHKPVLVWDDYWLMRIGYMHSDGWHTDAPCVEDEPIDINPTHWMPLPRVPKPIPRTAQTQEASNGHHP